MSHLGRWLSALVDGELDGVERDRVLNHVAGCAACRQEANAMRALKRRLTALGETCAESAIAGRLFELARVDQPRPASAMHGSLAWRRASPGLLAWCGPRRTRPSWKLATASAGSALIMIGLIAFLLGNGSGGPPAPKITPSVDSYLMQHSYDAGQAPAGSAPGSAKHTGGWGYGPDPYGAVRLHPGRFGLGQAGGLSQPAAAYRPGPLTSAAATPQPVASSTASPAPFSSATASPAEPHSGAHGGLPGTHAAGHTPK